MKPLILLALLLPLAAGAQVQKCTIDGKTVYSDSLCGQSGVTVNTDANNLDTSGLRALAAKREQKIAEEKAEEKDSDSKAKRSGSQGPCYAFEGDAYSDCMKRVVKEKRKR